MRAAMTSARVPALMLASCASATTLAASACSCLAIVSGLSIRTSTAPAATFWPRSTGISATRPSTRAAMSKRVASTSPCTSRGSGRTRYQIDRPAMAATTKPTMMEGIRVGAGGRAAGAFSGFRVTVSAGASGACIYSPSLGRPASRRLQDPDRTSAAESCWSNHEDTRPEPTSSASRPTAECEHTRIGNTTSPVFTTRDRVHRVSRRVLGRGATPAPRPAMPPRRFRAEIIGKSLPLPDQLSPNSHSCGRILVSRNFDVGADFVCWVHGSGRGTWSAAICLR